MEQVKQLFKILNKKEELVFSEINIPHNSKVGC